MEIRPSQDDVSAGTSLKKRQSLDDLNDNKAAKPQKRCPREEALKIDGMLSKFHISQQLSQDNRRSGRDNQAIDSTQHQQINPNSPDLIDSDDEREKNTELFSAIKNGNVQKLQELLNAGVKVNIVDKNNKDNTPLHYAVERDKKEMVEKLLQEWKAEINAKNNKGDTPLHIATSKVNKKLVQLLLSKKAEVNIKNNQGYIPVDIAKSLEKQDIVQILEPQIQPNLQASVEKQTANRQQLQENLPSGSNSGQIYNTQSSNQPKNLTLKQNSGRYKIQRRQGTTGGLDGLDYEINLLILGKLRGERDRDINKFYSSTNIAGLGAYDDIVIRYWKNNGEEEKSTTILLQAKHVVDPKKSKVTIEKFTNRKSDNFYLGKYFSDYLNSREKFNDKSEDPVFQGNSRVKYIIYTNAILDEGFDKNRKKDIDNSIFSTKCKEGKDKAFKFSPDDKNYDVIEILEKVSGQERIKSLAKALVSWISGKLNYNNMMGNEFFSTYHLFLAKNIIHVREEIKEDENKKEYREGKINHNFLNIGNKGLLKKLLKNVLYEYAENLVFKVNEKSSGLDDVSERNILVNKVVESLELSEKMDEDVIEKLGGSIIILDTKTKRIKFADQEKMKDESAKQFIRDLKSKVSKLADYEFKIPYEVVKKILKERTEKETLKLHVGFGNIRPSLEIKKREQFSIKKLVELCKQYKLSKIIKIDDNMVGPGKSLNGEDIKNIGKLVGNFLIFDEEKMLKLAKGNLNEDTLKFITNQESTAQLESLDVFSYRFDIKVKNFPRETLVTDDEDRTNVKEFLNKLEVHTGQASVTELEKIIKDEMRNFYKLTEEEAEESFLKVRNKAKEYWRKGDYYLVKGDDFFVNIVKFNIRFDVKEPTILFTGRTEQLKQLHEILQQGGEAVISQMAAVTGLGGIGKSELARKYISRYNNDYDNNFIWINAESYQALVESFRRLAQDKLRIGTKNIDGKEKDIKSIVEEVYRFFRKRKSLFIFDNTEKTDILKDFLPLCALSCSDNKPYILLISRENEEQWRQWGIKDGITLDVFTEEEAISFVKEGLKEELKGDNSQDEKIRELAVDTLSKFPLALQQAVAYIRVENKKLKDRGKGEYTIDGYLKDYGLKRRELLESSVFQSLDNDYDKTTFTTWKVTINKIKGNEEYKQLALKILDVIAYCAPNNIPVENFLSKLEDGDGQLWDTVDLLCQYSMVNLEEGVLSIHRLVQEVTRINLMEEKRVKEVLKAALMLFQSDSSQSNLFEDNFLLNGVDHAIDVDHAISAWSYASEHEELVREFNKLPDYIVSKLYYTLRFEEAYLFGSNAFKLLKEILGDDHFSVLLMMGRVTNVLHDIIKVNMIHCESGMRELTRTKNEEPKRTKNLGNGNKNENKL